MKKIFLFIMIFISAKVFGQFPVNQSLGSPKSQVYSKGAFGSDSGFIYRNCFTDTIQANRGFIKNIPGMKIRTCDDLEWMRNNTAVKWVITAGNNIDTLRNSLAIGNPIMKIISPTHALLRAFEFSGSGVDTSASNDSTIKVSIDAAIGTNKTDTVQTISQLQSYAGSANTLIVTDSLRGGIFHRVTSATADSGTVFNNSGSYFQRLYETSQGLNVEWFGAVPTFTLAAQSSPVMAANRIAIQNTINAAIKTGGRKITIPSGYFHIDSTIEVSTYLQAAPSAPSYNGTQIQIDGSAGSYLIINHATATLLRHASSGSLKFTLNNITLAGRGSATKGMLLEINGTSNWKLNNVEFKGHGGVGLFLTGGSERGETHGLQFAEVRQAIKTGIGASNENYFYNTIELSCGYAADNFTGGLAGSTVNYNMNTGSGIYYSEKHAIDHIRNATNIRFIGGSSKVTIIAGKKFTGCETIGVDNQYFEGFGLYANPSIIIGGASEKTHLTASFSNTAMSASVQDQSWFTQISTDARFDSVSDNPQLFVIYDSTAPTTYEVVSVYSFRNNVAKIKARAQNGTTALSWSSGACFREFLNTGTSGNAEVHLNLNHLESYQTLPSGFTSVDTTTNRGSTRGEVIVGYTPDEFHLTSYSFTPPATKAEWESNFTRAFGLSNGGKFQMWNNSSFHASTNITLSNIVAAQGDPNAPLVTSYTVIAPNINYTNLSSNNVPFSLLTNTYSTTLGGYGVTPIIAGERGVALSKSSLVATDIISFDDKAGAGLKYWKYNGADWIQKTTLFETSVRVGDVNVGIFLSNGSPNSVITATKGSLALDSANGVFYYKASGYGSTGWINAASIYTFSTGITNAANTITNNLSTGVSGGQTLIGSTSTNSGLTIQSTNASGTTGSDIIFKDDNTEWMRILNSGNVGIGNNNPQAKLHISRSALGVAPNSTSTLIVENGGDNTIQMFANNNATNNILFGNQTTDFVGNISFSNVTKSFLFKTNGNNSRMEIDSNGLVGVVGSLGVGTMAPANPFQISVSGAANSQFRNGTIEQQSYTTNNGWISDNTYFDGSAYKRRSAGYSGMLLFIDGEVQVRTGTTSTAGSSVTQLLPFKVHNAGNVALGGNGSTGIGIYTGFTLLATSAGVGIGTNGTAPNSKSILDLTSTTLGFLPPRMTSTQRTTISSVPAGLLIFDTDSASLFQYSGSAWQNLYNAGGGGGSGTVTSVSGTTNRITSTGGTTPVIDISSSYVGQSSITTHGTITNGGLGTGAVIGGVTMTLGSDATGDIYYRNGSGILTRIATGTSKQALHPNGSGAYVWRDTVTLDFDSIGDYTPTLYNTTNVTTSTAYPTMWQTQGGGIRITVTGQVLVDPTSAGAVVLGIEIPFATSLAQNYALNGVAVSEITGEPAYITADTTNNRALLQFTATSTASRTYKITFTYDYAPS